MESVIFRDVVSDRLSMLQRMTLHLIRIGTTDWTQWVIKTGNEVGNLWVALGRLWTGAVGMILI